MAERNASVIETIAPSQSGGLPLARLEFAVNGGCGRCHEEGGCGGVSLAQPLCAKPKSLLLPDPIGLAVGDTVRVSIPDQLLSRGITRTYVVPLLLFFAGSITGTLLLPKLMPAHWQMTQDVAAIAGAGLGLIAAWWQLQRSQRKSPMAAPRILEKI